MRDLTVTLDLARRRIGDGVVYRPLGGGPLEDGTIISVNDQYVFVLYLGDRHPKATAPEDLTFLGRGAV